MYILSDSEHELLSEEARALFVYTNEEESIEARGVLRVLGLMKKFK